MDCIREEDRKFENKLTLFSLAVIVGSILDGVLGYAIYKIFIQ